MSEKLSPETDKVLKELDKVANDLAPGTLGTQAILDSVATAEDPSMLNIASDLMVAKSLYTQIKATLKALPPESHNRIVAVLKAIF